MQSTVCALYMHSIVDSLIDSDTELHLVEKGGIFNEARALRLHQWWKLCQLWLTDGDGGDGDDDGDHSDDVGNVGDDGDDVGDHDWWLAWWSW